MDLSGQGRAAPWDSLSDARAATSAGQGSRILELRTRSTARWLTAGLGGLSRRSYFPIPRLDALCARGIEAHRSLPRLFSAPARDTAGPLHATATPPARPGRALEGSPKQIETVDQLWSAICAALVAIHGPWWRATSSPCPGLVAPTGTRSSRPAPITSPSPRAHRSGEFPFELCHFPPGPLAAAGRAGKIGCCCSRGSKTLPVSWSRLAC